MNTLIVSGGEINLDFLYKYYNDNKNSTIIAVDKGLNALHELSIIPHHIVGDFDSINKDILSLYSNNTNITIHKYNPKKDYTDTDIAIKLAINLNSSCINIIGGFGNRIDHLLANIHILMHGLNTNIPCYLLDTCNKVYLINSTTEIHKNKAYGKYISLIPLTSSVNGLTLDGFKYPLKNYTLPVGISLGISNEVVDDIATISFKEGILIVIESRD
jgi:thiamine pyrophosphokinase